MKLSNLNDHLMHLLFHQREYRNLKTGSEGYKDACIVNSVY